MSSTLPHIEGDAVLALDGNDRTDINRRARLYVVDHLPDADTRREVLEMLGLVAPLVEPANHTKSQRARVARNSRRHAQKARERAERDGPDEGVA